MDMAEGEGAVGVLEEADDGWPLILASLRPSDQVLGDAFPEEVNLVL